MKKEPNNKGIKITSQILVQSYLYLISFITLGVLVIGIGLTSKVLLSYKVSIPFSYVLSTANRKEDFIDEDETLLEDFRECYSGEEVMSFYDKDFCFDNSTRKTDLITGISLILSMSFLFGVHQYAISRIKKGEINVWIKKAYTFLSLLLYSFITILMIPLSIYSLTDFFLFEPTPDTYFTPSAPAISITILIVSIPLWIYFLKKTTQPKEK